MSKLEFLVATMDRENLDFFDNMNIKTNAIIINQSKKNRITANENPAIKIINCEDKGLSKSRNKAIENANAHICVLADDDIVYSDEVENIILKAYKENPQYDVIAFYVRNDNKNRAKKLMRKKKIGFINSMKLQSVQITFKREAIVNKNIKFDIHYGAGTNLYMGEENIFLFDCLKNDLKIYYIPEEIAYIRSNNSTWFKEYDEEYLYVRGKTYKRMFGKCIGAFISTQFVIRHYNLFKENIKFDKALKTIIKAVIKDVF